MFLESFLFFAQHVSALTEPIIRSTTVVCAAICFRFWCVLFRAPYIGVLPHHYFTVSRKKNSVALVRERTIPTERPPPVGEVSANFCG
jgi:hypothetical protein